MSDGPGSGGDPAGTPREAGAVGRDDREQVSQQPPSRPLDGFPAHTVRPGDALHRAHRRGLGPWWFSATGGRFDLPAPRGTCYLADDPLVALRERIGVVLGGADHVPVSLLEDSVVSQLHLAVAHRVADLTSRLASRYGVTRELETMVPYVVPQAWAVALHALGLEGVRYGPRFSTGTVTSLAVFGPRGEGPGTVDPDPLPGWEVPGAPEPLPVPRRDDLTVVRPPRTRGHPRAGPR